MLSKYRLGTNAGTHSIYLLSDAAELWTAALAKDPANTAFRAALDCVNRNPHAAAKRVKFVCVLFALILLLSGFQIIRGRHVSETISSDPPKRTSTAAVSLPGVPFSIHDCRGPGRIHRDRL